MAKLLPLARCGRSSLYAAAARSLDLLFGLNRFSIPELGSLGEVLLRLAETGGGAPASVESDVGQWRDANIIPRYNAAGVARFAFHMPEGMPMIGATPAPEGPATFPTGYFGSRQAALGWLSG